jgi:hypothetical protein
MSRIYTLQDLQARTLHELHALRGTLHRALAAAAPGSDACRDTLQSLAAVDRMIRLRTPGLHPRP